MNRNRFFAVCAICAALLVMTGCGAALPTESPTGLSAVPGLASVTLSWTAVSETVDGYHVYDGTTLVGTTAETSCSITELTSATNYSFTVCAYTSAGDGPATDALDTGTTGSSNNVPASAVSLTTSIRCDYLSSSSAVYYYFFATAGTTYRICWCDSYDGSAYVDYTPVTDIKVSAYRAGDTEYNVLSGASAGAAIDSGWTVSRTFTPAVSGNYVVKVEKYSATTSNGYYEIYRY
jgi:hypothetical protein